MKIHLTRGRGVAPTSLAAFDEALLDAGIANFNLLCLSSVIPIGSELVHCPPPPMRPEQWGERLYVVIAQQRETEIGREAWAGIGWVQEKETGRGLFVEHEGGNRQFIESQIHDSLNSMVLRREGAWGEIESLIVGRRCDRDPVCALAAAVYASEAWSPVALTSNGPAS
jgi:arginine decarboxylase